ncbi:MAG TPA: beta-ketoacyl-[acyl-carrier-protein] synthase family protein [Acidimicrobiales bacterium]|nr:beta-ketoacyl-[acyl-carrier-protein] synthase family protein [Acidimicrobiales bacterium]
MQLAWGRAGSEGVTARRVAITGLGILSCCGVGKDAFWDGLCGPAPNGERRVVGFDPSRWLGPKEVRRVDRFGQLTVAAADMALEDAGGVEVDPERAGVVMGTGAGGIETLETQFAVERDRGSERVSPFLVPMMMLNAGAAQVSMRTGWRGPCEAVSTACATGTHAVANAARLIASGRCEAMLAGGAEGSMIAAASAALRKTTAISQCGISRPFDARRDGFLQAEGAAVLVLEDLERARARGAHVYAEITGAASNADAHHVTIPAPGGSGAAACMELALADADLSPGQIGHINAHGTSTLLNDAAEAEAIAKVFGPPGPPLTSIKGVTGHAMGAAGAIEAVSVALTIERGLIPPTAGYEQPDPDIHLDVVAGAPRRWEPAPVLSNSFGFGGHNGCLVVAPVHD